MAETESIGALSEALVSELIEAGRSISVAESCTGGWIAKALTDIGGSSQCFGYGVVSYSNGAKESMLGVNPLTLSEHGAVSEDVVREMAEGRRCRQWHRRPRRWHRGKAGRYGLVCVGYP